MASIRDQALQKVVSVFQVVSKEPSTTRKGKTFLRLMLADSTGQIPALVWDNAESASRQFEVGNVLEIVGESTTYRNEIQIKVERIRRRVIAVLAAEDRPLLDPEMVTCDNASDCDGTWVSTFCDPSEAARIATEQKTNAIAAKYSKMQHQAAQPGKPGFRSTSKLTLDRRIKEIVRKYSGGDPEEF